MTVRFLSVEDVIAIHSNTLENEGGASGLRSTGLLEAAVLMPQQQFGGAYLHKGLPAMAAAYLFHLVSNHPFVDGNKRTGVLTALIFLDANKVSALPDPEGLEQVTMDVAAGNVGKRESTEWFTRECAE